MAPEDIVSAMQWIESLLREQPDLGSIDEKHLEEIKRREHMDRPFVTPPNGIRLPHVLRRLERKHLWRQE